MIWGYLYFWKHPFLSFLDVTLLKFPILQASAKIGVTSRHVPSISPPPISSPGIYSVISQNLGFPGTPQEWDPHSPPKKTLEVWESLWGPGVSRHDGVGSMVQIPLPTVDRPNFCCLERLLRIGTFTFQLHDLNLNSGIDGRLGGEREKDWRLKAVSLQVCKERDFCLGS